MSVYSISTKNMLPIQIMFNHITRLIFRNTTGSIKNRKLFVPLSTTYSFVSTFNESAINCKRPLNPIYFGPTRLWVSAKNFLSKSGSIPPINIKKIIKITFRNCEINAEITVLRIVDAYGIKHIPNIL